MQAIENPLNEFSRLLNRRSDIEITVYSQVLVKRALLLKLEPAKS